MIFSRTTYATSYSAAKQGKRNLAMCLRTLGDSTLRNAFCSGVSLTGGAGSDFSMWGHGEDRTTAPRNPFGNDVVRAAPDDTPAFINISKPNMCNRFIGYIIFFP